VPAGTRPRPPPWPLGAWRGSVLRWAWHHRQFPPWSSSSGAPQLEQVPVLVIMAA
jgi:hypothetical protein